MHFIEALTLYPVLIYKLLLLEILRVRHVFLSTMRSHNANCRRNLGLFLSPKTEREMSKEILKGQLEEIKGRATETVGKITGNRRRQIRGKFQKTKGRARKKIGSLKRRF